MKARVVIPIIIAIGLFVSVWYVHRHSTTLPVLRVYTYSSLAASWGAGPLLVEAFKQSCGGCEVALIDVKDGGVLLQRLLLERQHPQSDVILGLDQPRLRYASNHLEFQKLDAQWLKETKLQIDSQVQPYWNVGDQFVAFDWAPVTFVSRNEEIVKSLTGASMADFLKTHSHDWALPNPRTSTVGLAFLFWARLLAPQDWVSDLSRAPIKIVTSNWSQAYALFQKKQFDVALGYATSPLYHQFNEKNSNIKAIAFKAHVPHIEYAAIAKMCQQCELAEKFVKFLLSPEAQQIIWKNNYMFPMLENLRNSEDLKALGQFPLIDSRQWLDILYEQDKLLDQWDEILGKLAP